MVINYFDSTVQTIYFSLKIDLKLNQYEYLFSLLNMVPKVLLIVTWMGK